MKFVSIVILMIALTVTASDSLVEKKQNEAIDKLIEEVSKTDGNYSSISLKNWQKDSFMSFLSSEDMIRKVLNAFETAHRKLKVLDYLIVYSNKPNGGQEYDFLLIHHEPKPETYYRKVERPAKE